ncbi:hypothetical protein C8R47DRAFT_943071, partial [Mycena vitilis]
AKKSKKAVSDNAKDLFNIILPGDEDATVEIYDTCDELRRKINALLRTGTITKAALLRNMSRPTSGITSRVCYAAYVYFEKKRIAEGKAKSINKHRRDMEDRWDGQGGL